MTHTVHIGDCRAKGGKMKPIKWTKLSETNDGEHIHAFCGPRSVHMDIRGPYKRTNYKHCTITYFQCAAFVDCSDGMHIRKMSYSFSVESGKRVCQKLARQVSLAHECAEEAVAKRKNK